MLKDDKYIFRITHIDNINHILEHGITHKDSSNSNPDFKSIGDSSLINRRATFELYNGKNLGDYIPFYFGPRSPMQFVIERGHNDVDIVRSSDILYCISSINKVIKKQIPFIYCDGHATDRLTSFYNTNDVDDIKNQIDFIATNAKNWADWAHPEDLDFKRRKEAEFLIESDLPFESIRGFVVRRELVKDKLIADYGLNESQIHVNPEYYYD